MACAPWYGYCGLYQVYKRNPKCYFKAVNGWLALNESAHRW